MPEPIVVLPGSEVLPTDVPVLRADSRGVQYGDGIVETVHVRGGRPWLLEAHLARMGRAAAALDLALPGDDGLRDLAGRACAAWPADTEGTLRLVCDRGPLGGPPTVYATVAEVDPTVLTQRRSGVRVLTACQQVSATGRSTAPWLLPGIKTLSMAANQAARRWAVANDADETLWTSTDGYALEAPTANLVWLDGDVLCTVPAERTGVLAGITADWLLAHAADLGWRSEHRMTTPADLYDAQGVWLTSSIRGLAEVRALDRIPLASSPHTGRLRLLIGLPDR